MSFDCPVDLIDFVEPVTAPCGHTLCRGCYISWVAQALAGCTPECPTCRAPLARDPPAVNIIIRDAQTAAKQRRPIPALAIISEADLVVDTTPDGLLGEGGFGVVRRGAWQGTPVAVKSLQRDAAEVGEAPARAFDREMQVLARIKHPNVVPVFGVCHHADGRLSLVEELETGGTLYRRLHPVREGCRPAAAGGVGGAAASAAATAAAAAAAGPVRMTLGELAKVGLDVARALSIAHGAGITHNDVKSANVLFNAGGTAVLADFGLAKRVRNALPNTFAAMLGSSSGGGGGMLGTISHCAPENFDDESPHYGQPPGDIYSLGMVLFEMAVGLQPWEGRNIAQVMGAVTGGRRPAHPADVDGRVRALVERCWAHDPAARPTAAALVAELADLSLRVGGGLGAPAHSEILCLGDSITEEGWGLDGSAGWLSLLAEAYLHRAQIVNCGYAGYTTRSLAQKAESILSSRPAEQPFLLVTVFLGANDASHAEQHVPVDEYRERMVSLLAAAARVARCVVCIGPGPVDNRRWHTRCNAAVATYNDAAFASCASARLSCPTTPIHFVSLLAEATGTPVGPRHARVAEGSEAPSQSPATWLGLLRDGLHLSSAGNATLAQLLLRVLQGTPASPPPLPLGTLQQHPMLGGIPAPRAAAASAYVEFLGADTSTKGNWPALCGSDGYYFAEGSINLPQYATAQLSGHSSYTWGTPHDDVRALLVPGAANNGRLASCWYSETSFTVEINIAGKTAHRVGAYMVDWDGASFWKHARSHRIDVEDATTGSVLSSHNVSEAVGYEGGLHLAWLVRGAIRLRFTNTAGSGSINALLGGLLFGGLRK